MNGIEQTSQCEQDTEPFDGEFQSTAKPPTPVLLPYRDNSAFYKQIGYSTIHEYLADNEPFVQVADFGKLGKLDNMTIDYMTTGYTFHGLLAEFHLLDLALTDAQVAALVACPSSHGVGWCRP